MDKTKAVADWLRGFQGKRPKVSATGSDPGEIGLNVVQTDYTLRKFINGQADHRARFMVSFVADWSGGVDGVNDEASAYGQDMLGWVASQFPQNVPDMGAEVLRIEPVYNLPTIAIVDQANATAKYQFGFEIDYRE